MRISRTVFIFLLILSLMISGVKLLLYKYKETVLIVEENQSNNKRLVFIDAGHGGEDGGTSTADGTKESDINLNIAIRLNALCRLIGIDTKMTRNNDNALSSNEDTIAHRKLSDLKKRTYIINNSDTALLISIHQNYYSDRKYRGTQVFYAPTAGSKEFAKELQYQIRCSLQPNNKRQIKQASGIYIMQNIICPGVLVECSFLSNPDEASQIINNDYQKQFCSVIACTISKYLFENADIS